MLADAKIGTLMSGTDNAITLTYKIRDAIELNLSYMPFIMNGGLFVPTQENLSLGDAVIIELFLPGKNDALSIEGKVVWITPNNALHHVLAGVGVQFTGANAPTIRTQLEGQLDKKVAVGGYTYGITEK